MYGGELWGFSFLTLSTKPWRQTGGVGGFRNTGMRVQGKGTSLE